MDKYIIFGLLIVMALLLIIHLNRNNNVREKFANPQLPNLQACPASLNKYTSDVSINCCDGNVIQGKCQGEAVCTLSEKTEKLPRCIDYYKRYLQKMAKRHCPSDLRYFYEDSSKKNLGFCTSSPLNDKLSGPIRPNEPKCNVHKTNEKNVRDPVSCLVKKRMEVMVVPTPQSTRSVMQVNPQVPVILQANYIDELQSKMCYDRPTMDAALDVFYPNWRSDDVYRKGVYNPFNFCDKAKKEIERKAQDPNYTNPATMFEMSAKRQFRFPRLRVRRPRFGFRFKMPRFSWRPRTFGICK